MLFCLLFPSLEDDDEGKQAKQINKDEGREKKLFEAIEKEEFPIVEGILTAKTIMSCGSNPLLVAINVRRVLSNLSKNSMRWHDTFNVIF